MAQGNTQTNAVDYDSMSDTDHPQIEPMGVVKIRHHNWAYEMSLTDAVREAGIGPDEEKLLFRPDKAELGMVPARVIDADADADADLPEDVDEDWRRRIKTHGSEPSPSYVVSIPVDAIRALDLSPERIREAAKSDQAPPTELMVHAGDGFIAFESPMPKEVPDEWI